MRSDIIEKDGKKYVKKDLPPIMRNLLAYKMFMMNLRR